MKITPDIALDWAAELNTLRERNHLLEKAIKTLGHEVRLVDFDGMKRNVLVRLSDMRLVEIVPT